MVKSRNTKMALGASEANFFRKGFYIFFINPLNTQNKKPHKKVCSSGCQSSFLQLYVFTIFDLNSYLDTIYRCM
jgi:hypothetical protein